MARIKMFNTLFVTLCYSGYFPKAPGTIGTIVATLLAIPILEYLGLETLTLLTILITIISFKQIDIYEAKSKRHDPKEVVIDELIGVWIALIIASANMLQILFSFVYFRIFDILKPSIIGKVDKMPGSKGVVLDDALAGFFGGISSLMTYHLLVKVGII